MVKLVELDTDDSSDDVFSHQNGDPSRLIPSIGPGLVKEVKVEDHENDGSSNDESLYRNIGSSSTKPFSGQALVNKENLPRQSSGNLKTYFIGMGFSSVHVDKAIQENGDGDENLILETLIKYSTASPEPSDSWDDFETEEENSAVKLPSDYKQETEGFSGPSDSGLDKKSYLLLMDFSEEQIDLATSRLDVNASVPELADFILTAQTADSSGVKNNVSVDCDKEQYEDIWGDYEAAKKQVKKAKHMHKENNAASSSNHKQKPRQSNWKPTSQAKPNQCHEPHISAKGISIKEEMPIPCMPKGISIKEEMPIPRMPNPGSNSNSLLPKSPYFFYGNVMDVSQGAWKKLSQFLYATELEFANSQYFSALIRKEGYLHNLPTERRFHILPKPPLNLEDALPDAKKWWPSWDTRKQLNSITSETRGAVETCERLGRTMMSSQGYLSQEQKADIIHQCKRLNLIWAGPHKLRPIEPEQLESILGYPYQHTEILGLQLNDKLSIFKYCFQTDTIGYHLSVLKSMYTEGVRVLSIFSGIGGAEVALHRLGIRLICVVSVESSEINRNILKRWWQNTKQTGVLKQINGIEKLNTQMLKSYMREFGGFDIIIGSNPGEVARESSKDKSDKDKSSEINFTLYFEFVRVLQRVKSMMG